MNFKNQVKKFGFSLMEILIAVFIVAILALLTKPIIDKQINRTDEFSYYLAYKTVEKMAGQIVALGDPNESAATLLLDEDVKVASNEHKGSFVDYLKEKYDNSPINTFIVSIGTKFSNTQAYILSKFVPKSVADSDFQYEMVTQPWGNWESDDYDHIWLGYQVCKLGFNYKYIRSSKQVKNPITGANETIYTHYNATHFDNCCGYTKACNGQEKNQAIAEDLFGGPYADFCKDAYSNDLVTAITSQADQPSAKSFCEGSFSSHCYDNTSISINNVNHAVTVEFLGESNEDAEDEEEDDVEEGDQDTGIGADEEVHEAPASADYGRCMISTTFQSASYNQDSEQFTAQRPEFPTSWCTSNGYTNMTNDAAPDSIDCVCSAGYILSANNEKVCLKTCPLKGQLPYAKYVNGSYERECCSTDFDEKNNKCCPAKSSYNPASTQTNPCECISGYRMDNNVCVLENCPPGSQIDKANDVCIVNPPIIKGQRFCDLIAENWNISDSTCNTFQATGNPKMSVYKEVFEAAKGNNNKYLSVSSKSGAFNSLTPNIVFANGLKLWILGDKAASIAGLSYYADDIKERQNMCARVPNISTKEACNSTTGQFFCKSENVCLKLESSSVDKLGDARACCATTDMSGLQASAEEAGKDWKTDARSYAIPGFTVFVDINGDKGNGTLWEDVYPFYIGANGVVYPAYPLDGKKEAESVSNLLYTGGNSEKFLPVDVYYYDTDGNDASHRVTAFSGVSYARGACSARNISKYSPYCLNLGKKFNAGNGWTGAGVTGPTLEGDEYIQVDDDTSRNPCDHRNCYVAVRRKMKSL